MTRHLIEAYKTELDRIAAEHPDVTEGKLFGCVAYYINKKMTVCLFDEYLFIKLPADRAAETIRSNPDASDKTPMDPTRGMGKEWVFLKVVQASLITSAYKELIEESFDHLRRVTSGL